MQQVPQWNSLNPFVNKLNLLNLSKDTQLVRKIPSYLLCLKKRYSGSFPELVLVRRLLCPCHLARWKIIFLSMLDTDITVIYQVLVAYDISSISTFW